MGGEERKKREGRKRGEGEKAKGSVPPLLFLQFNHHALLKPL